MRLRQIIKRERFKYGILAALTLAATACTPGSCFEETNAYMKANFFLSETGKSAAPDSITLYGLGAGYLPIYNKSSGVVTALIPLNAAEDYSGFAIKINGVSDTLKAWYSSFPHLVSKECGYTYFHVLDSVISTNNIIDDIIIRNRNVTTFKEENIRIFY